MKTIASFDIGIRNLAVCVLEGDGTSENYKIKHWRIINLIDNPSTKVKSISIQKLGISLTNKLDAFVKEIKLFDLVDEVIMELQPSFNPKMKSISNMLYQYFIMRGMIDCKLLKSIKFVRAKNKLKVYDGPPIECNLKTKYSKTKKLGISYCRYFINNNLNQQFIEFFDSNKKKDDLADSFLQGAWYLNSTLKE